MKNINNLEELQKAVNEVASLCTCDFGDIHFSQVWSILESHDLVYDCENCKHWPCGFPKEWHCLKKYPPEFYEDNRIDTSEKSK